jgi:hypothetical protein
MHSCAERKVSLLDDGVADTFGKQRGAAPRTLRSRIRGGQLLFHISARARRSSITKPLVNARQKN